MHTLLDKQIKRSTATSGDTDHSKLYDYISTAYAELDQERKRTDRAHWLMAEELDNLNSNLENVVDELSVQNLRFEAAIDNMTQGLCMIGADGKVAIVNNRFLEIYQIGQSDYTPGMAFSKLLGASRLQHREISLFSDVITHYLVNDEQETRQSFPTGEVVSVITLPMKDGGFVLTVEDITERVTSEARIRHLAHHDALTGLPNRLYFQVHLSDAVNECQGNGSKLLLMYIDLDHFKEVNDTLGHDAGDELLVQVSRRVETLLGKDDLFARLGGDEFAIIRQNVVSKKETSELAQTVIDTISRPYSLNGDTATIGASIGISLNCGKAGVELQKKADLALYSSKHAGRGMFNFFLPKMNLELQMRKALENDLRQAVNKEQFEVYYQPLVDSQSGNISSFEALVRWNHPTRGLVSPLEFIQLAEQVGEIDAIGDFVLRQACQKISQHSDQNIAVNFSPVQFRNPDLAKNIKRHLDEIGCSPEKLSIEITEHTLLDNNPATMKTLTQLKDMGISIVMDDFGTGYSSMNYLRLFPFDKIKIDRNFVKDIADNPNDQAIVDSIVFLGKRLGMTVVAEGIETEQQASILTSAGCDELQGFYYSKPVPEMFVDHLIDTQGSRSQAFLQAQQPGTQLLPVLEHDLLIGGKRSFRA